MSLSVHSVEAFLLVDPQSESPHPGCAGPVCWPWSCSGLWSTAFGLVRQVRLTCRLPAESSGLQSRAAIGIQQARSMDAPATGETSKALLLETISGRSGILRRRQVWPCPVAEASRPSRHSGRHRGEGRA